MRRKDEFAYLECAKRELAEEAELQAEHWLRLDLAEIDKALPEIRDATTVIALLRLKEQLGG